MPVDAAGLKMLKLTHSPDASDVVVRGMAQYAPVDAPTDWSSCGQARPFAWTDGAELTMST